MIYVEKYTEAELPALREIWNEVVREGVAFPQLEELSEDEAREFFASQDFTAAAKDESGRVLGLYILHPNNVGRCGHQCNASYAVASAARGMGVGEALVRHSLAQAAARLPIIELRAPKRVIGRSTRAAMQSGVSG